MRRDLLRRVDRLEAHLTSSRRGPVMLVWYDLVDDETRAALAPGERIVEDWDRENERFAWMHERITTDADDFGKGIALGRLPP